MDSTAAFGALQAAETAVLAKVRPDHRAGRQLAAAVSEATRQGRLWIGLSALAASSTRTRRAGADALAAWGLASGLAFGVKRVVDRRRPRFLAGLGSAPSSSSMPSSHTAGAVAYATVAALAVPATAPVVVPLAAFVAWSRAATGRHFPTDVAVGAALGVAAGSTVHLLRRGARQGRSDELASDPDVEAQRVDNAEMAPGTAATTSRAR